MKYITPIRRPSAQTLLGQVYRQIKQDFGLIADPFALHSPVPELLAGLWSVTRETGIAPHVPWPIKEAVAAAVSQSNACPYCVEIHAAVASRHDRQSLVDLIKEGRTEEIADPTLRAIVAWASASGTASTTKLLPTSFSAQERAELLGVAVTFHYLNRLVNVFLPESLLPKRVREGWLGERIWSQIGRRLAREKDRVREVGTSFRFLPDAELPAELSWAAASPAISRAFAGWAALLEQKGAEILSPQVRLLVREQLAHSSGGPPALGRGWVEKAIAPLSKADQGAGRLALLTALASSQIDEHIIEDFRTSYPTDAQLVGATAWASAAAARRVAGFLAPSTVGVAFSHPDKGSGERINN